MNYHWHYYDVVLLVVLVGVLLGGFVGYVTGLAPTVTVAGGWVIALGVVFHSLCVNGPVERPTDLTDEVAALN